MEVRSYLENPGQLSALAARAANIVEIHAEIAPGGALPHFPVAAAALQRAGNSGAAVVLLSQSLDAVRSGSGENGQPNRACS